MNDQKKREEKKNNLVIFNVEEGTDNDDGKNKQEDVTKTKELLKFVNPEVKIDSLDQKRIHRIGTMRGNKPRPIRVIMDSQESKNDILKNSKKLKGSEKFSKIGLSFDKTKKQQEEYRLLKAKLEEKNKEGEGNEYTIFRNKIVKRTEVPNLTHKLKQAEGTNWASNAPIGGNSGGAALNAEKKNDSSE